MSRSARENTSKRAAIIHGPLVPTRVSKLIIQLPELTWQLQSRAFVNSFRIEK